MSAGLAVALVELQLAALLGAPAVGEELVLAPEGGGLLEEGHGVALLALGGGGLELEGVGGRDLPL